VSVCKFVCVCVCVRARVCECVCVFMCGLARTNLLRLPGRARCQAEQGGQVSHLFTST
jgi:hypothetical protein